MIIGKKNSRLGFEGYLKKMKEKKTEHDMIMLTEIYNICGQRELTIEELKFLYEIDEELEDIIYMEDHRIVEILSKRNFKEDLARVFECSEDEISNESKDIINGKKVICFYGDLLLDDVVYLENLTFPEYVIGKLSLSNLKKAKDLIFPASVKGDFRFSKLESVENISFPKPIKGSLSLDNLTYINGLVLPRSIDGNLDLACCGEGLIFPDFIGGHLSIKYTERFSKTSILPDTVLGSVHLKYLKSAKNLRLPDYIGGSLKMPCLESQEGLVLPSYIGGDLVLGFKKAEKLYISSVIGKNIVCNLEIVKGLTMPGV